MDDSQGSLCGYYFVVASSYSNYSTTVFDHILGEIHPTYQPKNINIKRNIIQNPSFLCVFLLFLVRFWHQKMPVKTHSNIPNPEADPVALLYVAQLHWPSPNLRTNDKSLGVFSDSNLAIDCDPIRYRFCVPFFMYENLPWMCKKHIRSVHAYTLILINY